MSKKIFSVLLTMLFGTTVSPVFAVKVAIVDTGCNIEYEKGISFVDDTPADPNGHGTAIAQIIKGVNPEAKLYIAKVFPSIGIMFGCPALAERLAQGIYWAIFQQVDIILLPWETREDWKPIREAIQRAYNQGILLVAAAGNEGGFFDLLTDEAYKNSQKQNTAMATEVKYPARYAEVVAIGAIDSFFGRFWRPANSAVGPEVEFVCNGSYGSRKGTSFAAARATAIIAKIKADYPDLDGPQLREILKFHSRDLGDKGRDTKFGYGRLDAHRSGYQLARDLHYLVSIGVILFATLRAVI